VSYNAASRWLDQTLTVLVEYRQENNISLVPAIGMPKTTKCHKGSGVIDIVSRHFQHLHNELSQAQYEECIQPDPM
jgi:hypothetical protein